MNPSKLLLTRIEGRGAKYTRPTNSQSLSNMGRFTKILIIGPHMPEAFQGGVAGGDAGVGGAGGVEKLPGGGGV